MSKRSSTIAVLRMFKFGQILEMHGEFTFSILFQLLHFCRVLIWWTRASNLHCRRRDIRIKTLHDKVSWKFHLKRSLYVLLQTNKCAHVHEELLFQLSNWNSGSYCLCCSDHRAQVDDEDMAVMNLIRSDDWV